MWLPSEFDSSEPAPQTVFGYVSVNSQGGQSALEVQDPARLAATVEAYRARPADLRRAGAAVESAGLQVTAESRLGLAVAGPPGAFEELTGGSVVAKERLLRAEAGRQRFVTHLDIVGSGQPEALGVGLARSAAARIEGVLLERPRIPLAGSPSPIPPGITKFHLRVPDDVAVLLNATAAHREGHDGAGVNVAMVDSGQYAHPFFLAHHYDVRPAVSLVPGASPAKDPVGHGTGESANIFAVAPAATLRPYRASNNQGHLVAAIGGFLRAKGDSPHILTNSWGGDGPFPPPGGLDEFDQVWSLEISDAIDQGIVVVFSAGNGQFSVEPQVPGVLAAGGAYVGPGLTLQASTYASGYMSPWFTGVNVPLVCGLVGLRPRAQYLLLPVPPGCEIDIDESQAVIGDSADGTLRDDGWALFSGTSAAAPQLAGSAALVLGAKAGLTPAQVREALSATAIDVTAGRCNPRYNEPAAAGPDVATGHGLVNARGAVRYAMTQF